MKGRGGGEGKENLLMKREPKMKKQIKEKYKTTFDYCNSLHDIRE